MQVYGCASLSFSHCQSPDTPHGLWVRYRHPGGVHCLHLLRHPSCFHTHTPSSTSNTNKPYHRTTPRHCHTMGRPMSRSRGHSQRDRRHGRCQTLQHSHPLFLSGLHGHNPRYHWYTPGCCILGQQSGWLQWMEAIPLFLRHAHPSLHPAGQ